MIYMIGATCAAIAGMITFGLLWLRTLRELHDAKAERDGYWDKLNSSATSCDASMSLPGGFGGPCTLRVDHDGPVHQDANGVQWTEPLPATEQPDWALDAVPANAETPDDTWMVTVKVPTCLSDELKSSLFEAVAEAAHDWEPADRDGWDVDVTGCTTAYTPDP